ncbi:hypothetical protein DBR32_00420 [Taibaiella sp. KBW10]|uniref:hypothetical protein n=1 Tax=Taibaiella sp. KBW10 TaxID=2153357 RepID=UPI000F5AAFDA|nr:hypothetical protein [Taibaiella sp. KBW10]RQO32113.1 hypothetical protein DBR32_00420 [Taibaiella sp. KBW10]
MSEDTLYISLGYVLSWVSMILLCYGLSKAGSSKRWRSLLVNLVLQALYSLGAWYLLKEASGGGSGLLWLSLLLMMLGIHFVVNIGYSLICYLRYAPQKN